MEERAHARTSCLLSGTAPGHQWHPSQQKPAYELSARPHLRVFLPVDARPLAGFFLCLRRILVLQVLDEVLDRERVPPLRYLLAALEPNLREPADRSRAANNRGGAFLPQLVLLDGLKLSCEVQKSLAPGIVGLDHIRRAACARANISARVSRRPAQRDTASAVDWSVPAMEEAMARAPLTCSSKASNFEANSRSLRLVLCRFVSRPSWLSISLCARPAGIFKAGIQLLRCNPDSICRPRSMSATIGPAAAPGAEGTSPLPAPATMRDARLINPPALPDPVWGRDSRRGTVSRARRARARE